MPYKVVKRGPKWYVEKSNGKDFGAHDSEADAKKQMAALYAAEPRAAETSIRALHLHRALGTAKIEMINKREHLVVPVIALMEGVIHAVNAETPEFVPLSTLQKAASTWNDKPVTVYHPKKDGKQCSASAPGIAEAHHIGFIRNSRVEGTKLLQEACIDKIKAKTLAPDMWERLLEDKWEEVSVGAFVVTDGKPGTHSNGKAYHGTWIDTAGDHLAFLPGGRGACSIEMGCGAHRAAMRVCEASLELEVLGGPGSGNFGHGGRPGERGGSGDGGDGPEKSGSLARSHGKTSQEHASSRDMLDIAARPDHFKQTPEQHEANKKQAIASAEKALSKTTEVVGKGDAGSRPGPYLTHAKEAVSHAKAGRFKEAASSADKASKAHEQAERTLKKFEKMRNASLAVCVAYSTLGDQSLEERMSAVRAAVEKKWGNNNNNSGGAAISPSEYAYTKQIFDNSVIVEVGPKCYAVPYDVDKDGTVKLGEATEVKMTYVAAEYEHDHEEDCHCGGACDECKEHRAAAGARHSSGDMKLIQAMHDNACSLGAVCDMENS